MQLKDQAAIVTGGASGLGAATARKLAGQGAKVAVCDLNTKLAEELAKEIGGGAGTCDVADAAAGEAAGVAAGKGPGAARGLGDCARGGGAQRGGGPGGAPRLAGFYPLIPGQPNRP